LTAKSQKKKKKKKKKSGSSADKPSGAREIQPHQKALASWDVHIASYCSNACKHGEALFF
jgi:hypothetical protein